MFQEAKARQCQLLALPECFAWIGRGPPEALAFAQPLDGPLFPRYAELCRQHNMWASFGGFHARPAASDDQRLQNTHVLVDHQGRTVTTYVKVWKWVQDRHLLSFPCPHQTHLFDVSTADGEFKESGFSRPGERLSLLRNTPLGHLGLTICYDVRFPPVYDALRAAGADTLLVPSAFMPRCGGIGDEKPWTQSTLSTSQHRRSPLGGAVACAGH